MPNPNKMKSKSPSASRQTGGRYKESMPGVRGSGEMKELKATGKSYVKPKMAGTSAAGSGKRGIRDIAKGAAPKGPGKDGKYKPGDMFRSGRIVQPSVAPGKSKPKVKSTGSSMKAVAAGRAKAANRAKTNAAGRGKSASQDMNKRPVKALYKNK